MLRVTRGEITYHTLSVVFISLLLSLMVIPLLFVLSTSMTPVSEQMRRGWFVLYPTKPTLASYRLLLEGGWIQRALMISVARTIIGVACTLTVTTLGAYCLSRKRLPGRKYFLLLVLVTILFGGGLIPTYLLYRSVGLVNKFWVYIVPGLVDSWGLLVIKQFMERQPVELEEAAHIDGATNIQILLRVIIPLSTPVLAAIGLFQAVGAWNSWTDSLIYVSNAKLWSFQFVLRNMLQTTLLSSMSTEQQLDPSSMELYMRASPESLKMAAVVIGTIPILSVYPFLQKYFTKGVLIGSIKG